MTILFTVYRKLIQRNIPYSTQFWFYQDQLHNYPAIFIHPMLNESLVITWCVLWLWMEMPPPNMEGNHEYVEWTVTDK